MSKFPVSPNSSLFQRLENCVYSIRSGNQCSKAFKKVRSISHNRSLGHQRRLIWSATMTVLSGHIFTSRLKAMGIRDRPISPGSPWQNGIAERLIGTVRRECLDRIRIFGESHLRRVLASYAAYYNQTRTHLALQKDAPLRRTVQRSGAIVAIPILAGLHHQYVRI